MPPILPFYYLCHINPQKIMELSRYFYHPDHTSIWLSIYLGSSASTRLSNLWITDNTGRPIQHLHYLPFGEDWIEQRNSSWNTSYTFSAKEKDVETGYHYFGARYYDSDLSIWLSVDPMSDKYPSMSPYVYCANNPVILTDPDGRWIPGLDENGNVTYTAEKGDNYDSFISQFDTQGKGKEIFKNAGLKIGENDVKQGAIIKGSNVQKAIGTDILKGNWDKMTNGQKVAQTVFAILHSELKGESSFDFKDYFNRYPSKLYGGFIASNFNMPTVDGDIFIKCFSIYTGEYSKCDNWYSNVNYDEKGDKLVYNFKRPFERKFHSQLIISIAGAEQTRFEKLLDTSRNIKKKIKK